jgi:hypothetical protein
LNDIGLFIHNDVYASGFLFDILTIKSLGIPCVAINHGTFATSLVAQDDGIGYGQYLFKLVDRLIVLARDEEFFWRIFDVSATFIPNPVAWRIEEVRPASLRNKNIVWVGRLSFEKRASDALEIFSLVVREHDDARLFIVGQGETPDSIKSLKQRAAELGVDDAVIVCGFHRDVSAFYEIASVCLITSQLESFSMSLLESKVHGVPTVLYDLPNLELLRDRLGVIPVEHRDMGRAARAIGDILGNRNYREHLGKEARSSAEAFLASHNIEAAWREVLDDQAGDRVDHSIDPEIRRAIKTNFETIFYTHRAGLEWREAHFVPRWHFENELRKLAAGQGGDSDASARYLQRVEMRVMKSRLVWIIDAAVRWTETWVLWRKGKTDISLSEDAFNRAKHALRALHIAIAYSAILTVGVAAAILWGLR